MNRDRYTNWRKSPHSDEASNCVECAGTGFAVPLDRVGVRDSTRPDGPTLEFGPAPWNVFLTGAWWSR